ncbi:hypothetical protein BOW53_03245 [Solemya pervernicosa gill symbiont]|uniref:Uncharacterized protein n=1 Tax=Solemya pervernicosa gill symbiont TaxID=642797 RepID=A0A1T2L8W0_9GAMM|nr:hypothetical protein BOW53_03245 [Solemya pervernicosa gill symbiont]
MKGGSMTRMLDRAPVLFNPRGNLANIGDQSVEVAAVDAVESFNDVEIAQVVTVDDDIVASPNPGYTVEREADGVEQANAEID